MYRVVTGSRHAAKIEDLKISNKRLIRPLQNPKGEGRCSGGEGCKCGYWCCVADRGCIGLVALSYGVVSLYEVVSLACPLALLGVGLLRGSLALCLACGETRPFGAALRIPYPTLTPALSPLGRGEPAGGACGAPSQKPLMSHLKTQSPTALSPPSTPYRFHPPEIKYRLAGPYPSTFICLSSMSVRRCTWPIPQLKATSKPCIS